MAEVFFQDSTRSCRSGASQYSSAVSSTTPQPAWRQAGGTYAGAAAFVCVTASSSVVSRGSAEHQLCRASCATPMTTRNAMLHDNATTQWYMTNVNGAVTTRQRTTTMVHDNARRNAMTTRNATPKPKQHWYKLSKLINKDSESILSQNKNQKRLKVDVLNTAT